LAFVDCSESPPAAAEGYRSSLTRDRLFSHAEAGFSSAVGGRWTLY
jgi:hypothetical protein